MLNPINHKRLAARRAETHGPQTALAKGMCCCACGSPHNVEPDHYVTRAAGGLDRGNVTPLCSRCHDEKGRMGDSFDLQRGPFRLYHPDYGQLVPGTFGALEAAALALEEIAYPAQACGHSWDWIDLSDTGERICAYPECLV